jgi:phosphopantothenoylcysteine decarboxylase/phosphopantothenate--cysteine ligase
MNLSGKKILLGVTGGIAAYKSAHLTRLLRKASADLEIVMTKSAQQFITPHTLAVLSEKKVHLDFWDDPTAPDVKHIHLADWAELAVIAPATANILAKAATGIGDDLLSTMLLCFQCPVVMVPAMHSQMWTHPATQRNVDILSDFGYHVIVPEKGDLASGDTGVGRMPEPEQIIEYLESIGS